MQMMFSVLAVVLALSSTAMQAQAKSVFAHFIVGNAASFTQADWASDMTLASQAGIDGFALNIAGDQYTQKQLDLAYAAADAAGNFKLFLSFDYAANQGFPSFTAQKVSDYINTYKTHKSQFTYKGLPLVSTFEGTDNAGDVASIRAATGGIFFVPEWTSKKGSPGAFASVDGALSWDVWPVGPSDMDSTNDRDWQRILGSKAYMMGISPWFYTNLPGKNFLWRGNNLWHDRWQTAIELQPDFIEILTWNDFGESHYIGPLHPSTFPAGSEKYVANMPHDSWRDLLPYYIAAYKSANTTLPVIDHVKIVHSHKPNPSSAGSNGGTSGNAPWQAPASPDQVSLDAISLSVLVKAPADVTVQIGDHPVRTLRAKTAGVNHFSVPFKGETGTVTYTVSRDGRLILKEKGNAISENCEEGKVNWNAIVGGARS